MSSPLTDNFSLTGNLSAEGQLSGTIENRSTITGNIMETVLKGLSAYEIAVKNGYEGTETEWLRSLAGESVTVEVVKETVDEYILKFIAGEEEFTTPNLKQVPKKGIDYFTSEDIDEFLEEVSDDVLAIVGANYQHLETGKGLSTNDYSNDDKTRVDAIPTIESNVSTNTNSIELINAKLNTLKISEGNKNYWDVENKLYIPAKNEIVIYTDYYVDANGLVPNIKIGDGSVCVIDLPFVNQHEAVIFKEHIADGTLHVTAADKLKWDNKVACNIDEATETIIFYT